MQDGHKFLKFPQFSDTINLKIHHQFHNSLLDKKKKKKKKHKFAPINKPTNCHSYLNFRNIKYKSISTLELRKYHHLGNIEENLV